VNTKETEVAGIQFISKAKQAKCIPSNFYIIPFRFHDIFCIFQYFPVLSSFMTFSACEEVSDIKYKTNYIPGQTLWMGRHAVTLGAYWEDS